MRDDAAVSRVFPAAVLTWAWAAGSVVLLAPAALGALLLLAIVRIAWPGFVPDHGMELAAFIVTWGVLGMAGAASLARLILGQVEIVHRVALYASGVGLAIAAVLQVVLHDWAVGKLGYYEPDVIGPTVMLPLGLAPFAVAMFGVAVAQPPFDLAPRIAVIAGGLMAMGAVALNIPGTLDGIGARAIALAVVLASVPAYVLVSWAIALRR
jgi:hypothetical protein